MSDDERALRTLVDTWMAATQRGDLPTVLDLMTDDVVFMTPGRKPFGKQEFAAASEGQQGMKFQGESRIQEIEVQGDWAWMRTYLEVTMTPDGAAPMKRSGYTMSVLRRENGKWRIARDANMLGPPS